MVSLNGLWDRALKKCQATQTANTFIKLLKKRVMVVIVFSTLLNKQKPSGSASCEKKLYIIHDEFNIIGMKSTYVLYKSRRF